MILRDLNARAHTRDVDHIRRPRAVLFCPLRQEAHKSAGHEERRVSVDGEQVFPLALVFLEEALAEGFGAAIICGGVVAHPMRARTYLVGAIDENVEVSVRASDGLRGGEDVSLVDDVHDQAAPMLGLLGGHGVGRLTRTE